MENKIEEKLSEAERLLRTFLYGVDSEKDTMGSRRRLIIAREKVSEARNLLELIK